jgi:tRNA(Arg) A34 adenosine deaminase TadA
MLTLLRLAAEIAVSSGDEARSFVLGAVAVRNRDGVIVRSTNGSAYFPYGPAHAEARVLKKAGKHAVIYVARVSRRDGKLTMSRPCSGCQELMKSLKVRKCFYTISENEYGIIEFDNNEIFERQRLIKSPNGDLTV